MQRLAGQFAEAGGAGQVDAQLLDDAALHFDDAHFQHHLICGADVQHIDDLQVAAGRGFREEGLHQAADLIGLGHVIDHPRQDDAAIDTFDLDPCIGNMPGNSVFQGRKVCLHRDIEVQQGAPCPVEDQRVGLAKLDAAENDPLRGLHDGVCDLGIGNHHIGGRRFQINDHRLVDPERDPAGDGLIPWLGDAGAHAVGHGLSEGQRSRRGGNQGSAGQRLNHAHGQLLPIAVSVGWLLRIIITALPASSPPFSSRRGVRGAVTASSESGRRARDSCPLL